MPIGRGRILVTGATGYIGGRLLRALDGARRPVRCLARSPESLAGRVGLGVEVAAGDVLQAETLPAALAGIDTAYYLIHSLSGQYSFEETDRIAARNFADAARAAGVRRIVYLGGLGNAGTRLSSHLRSRHEVGEILRGSGMPVIEFRASIIIGSGSISFDIMRALVERLPVMTTPTWVRVRTQPIAVEDVIAYLMAALDVPAESSQTFEIGGADKVSYADILRIYSAMRGLRRWLIPLPALSPRLSSLWLSLVTPVHARVGRRLVDGLRNTTTVEDDVALRVFPIRPMGVRQAIERALIREDQEISETRWSDALSSSSSQRPGGMHSGTRIVDSRTITVACDADRAFAPIRRIGGEAGWYYGTWLWRLRGRLDLLVGGVGLRRGRKDPEHIHVGESLDFWRVEQYEPNRRLRLRAEMRLPGRAWLEFEVREQAGGTMIRQTAEFDPLGLLGLVYWYALYPFHALIFGGMLRAIARAALTATDETTEDARLKLAGR